ncbi:hypothetical protein BDV95DRAFT_495105, partial [Massariosphaeria phaeospora]
FGVVLAVSHAKSPRREGLLYAADLTGINITIPEQPVWTKDDLDGFKSTERSRISRGSALAWMGHLNALEWFLSTPLDTALILEDDVDWDITLRLSQIPLAAAATRLLFSTNSTRTNLTLSDLTPQPPPRSKSLLFYPLSPFSFNKPHSPYWPPTPSWEILYLGHCGDAPSPADLSRHPYTTYHDASVPPFSALHPVTQSTLTTHHLPPSTRLIHRSHWPLCTFAYAVTRASARRILADYGTEGPNGCAAFDVRILEACRDKGWGCWTVEPELFHHMEGRSEIAGVDEREDDKGVDSGERQTWNIGCSARQRGVWVHEGDEEQRDMVREAVGRGECLVDEEEEEFVME